MSSEQTEPIEVKLLLNKKTDALTSVSVIETSYLQRRFELLQKPHVIFAQQANITNLM